MAIEGVVEPIAREDHRPVEGHAQEGASRHRVRVAGGVGRVARDARPFDRSADRADCDGQVGPQRDRSRAAERVDRLGRVEDQEDGVQLAARLHADRHARAADGARRGPLAVGGVAGEHETAATLESCEEAHLRTGMWIYMYMCVDVGMGIGQP